MNNRILRPCPFCGKIPHFAESSARGEGYHCWYWCDCGIGTDPFKNAPELISYWNRRSSPAESEPCKYCKFYEGCEHTFEHKPKSCESAFVLVEQLEETCGMSCFTPEQKASLIDAYTSRLVQEAIITERNRCISAAIAYADNHGAEIAEGDLRGLLVAMMGEEGK